MSFLSYLVNKSIRDSQTCMFYWLGVYLTLRTGEACSFIPDSLTWIGRHIWTHQSRKIYNFGFCIKYQTTIRDLTNLERLASKSHICCKTQFWTSGFGCCETRCELRSPWATGPKIPATSKEAASGLQYILGFRLLKWRQIQVLKSANYLNWLNKRKCMYYVIMR